MTKEETENAITVLRGIADTLEADLSKPEETPETPQDVPADSAPAVTPPQDGVAMPATPEKPLSVDEQGKPIVNDVDEAGNPIGQEQNANQTQTSIFDCRRCG